MRADRLVATLLLLQARGTVTAKEVADELEVSERTARRDLDALAVAGIPVFSRRGRGGGWQLVGGARTDLTGLRSAEARALLTMAAATGVATPEFTSAIRKLTQALPEPIRTEAEQVMASTIADASRWGNSEATTLDEPRRDHWLEPLQRAVIERRSAELTYETPRKGSSRRRIEPLGLVIKAGHWYLVANTAAGRRTFRVDRILDVVLCDETFDRPDDFDLAIEWSTITTGYIERSTRLTSEAIVEHWALPVLRVLGVETTVHPTPRSEGRVSATLGAWNVEVLAGQIAGVMHGIELVDPPPGLVERLHEIGSQLVSRFAPSSEG